jgi:two-component system sensor histidine kinase HupT/HoxJ
MGLNIIYFLMLNVSFIFLVGILIYVLKLKNKTQLHYAFISFISATLIWTAGYLGLFYWYYCFNYDNTLFIKVVFTGVILTPLSVFFLGYIFAYSRIKITFKFKLLFVIPLISLIIMYTNEYHGLFYTYFSAQNVTYRSYGYWTTIHIIYSYILVFVGLWYLIYFTIKNSGFFSNQSKLILTGLIFPLIINMLITSKIGGLPYYFESIAFTFAVIFFALAIFKYKFLNIVPISLQRIVDLISDGYMVINENFDIIDYNKTLIGMLSGVLCIKRKDNLIDILSSSPEVGIEKEEVLRLDNQARESNKTVSFEKHILTEGFDKHFKIEITPINSQDGEYLGTIIFFKDITQNIKDIETIKENQAILIEQERLVSLGQLIGGIAHNLKTPIMSLAGGIEGLRDLINEYIRSIGDPEVTEEDHREIAQDMLDWLDKMKPYCSYMSDVITTVKGQAVHLNASSGMGFTLNELIKRIDILMKHELIKANCTLETDIQVHLNTELKGDVNTLVQIFDNLIINAIHSYEGKNGRIVLKITRVGDTIEFSVRDFGKGIPGEIKDRLFKEMVTTKGKNGTGLGLYMSYSTIKGRFGGNMWFTSKKDRGTTFYVSIPCME